MFSCSIDTSDPLAALGIEIWVDDNRLFDSNHIEKTEQIQIELDDNDGEHELIFVLKHKTDKHTQIDANGNIMSDATLFIADVAFDEIQLGNLLSEKAVYAHNFNGTKEPTEEKFYGVLGCNGTVSLKFTTPIYLWLLENM